MIVDIKKIIENKKDREFYLECFNSGVSFEEICNIHNKTIEYKNLLRNENIRAQNFFKSGDTDKESFLNFFNTVEKTIIKSQAKKKMRSFFSNKHKGLYNEETLYLFCDLIENKASKGFYDSFKKKISAFKNTEDLNQSLIKELTLIKSWNIDYQMKRIGNLKTEIKNNKIIFEVNNYEESKLFGTSMWCICRDRETFEDYKENATRIYFRYDFNKYINDPEAMIAVLVKPDGNIINAYDKNDDIIKEKTVKDFKLNFSSLSYEQYVEEMSHLEKDNLFLSFYKNDFSETLHNNEEDLSINTSNLRIFLTSNFSPNILEKLIEDKDKLFNRKDYDRFFEIIYSTYESRFGDRYNDGLEKLFWNPDFIKSNVFNNLSLLNVAEEISYISNENIYNFILVKNINLEDEFVNIVKKQKRTVQVSSKLFNIFKEENIDIYKILENRGERELLKEVVINSLPNIKDFFNLEKNVEGVFEILKEEYPKIKSMDIEMINNIGKKYNVKESLLINEDNSQDNIVKEILRKPNHIFIKNSKIEKYDINFNYNDSLTILKKVLLEEDLPFRKYEKEYVSEDIALIGVNHKTLDFIVNSPRINRRARNEFNDFIKECFLVGDKKYENKVREKLNIKEEPKNRLKLK